MNPAKGTSRAWRLKSDPCWQLADSLARINAKCMIGLLAALGRDEDREEAVLEVLDTRAEPFLELVEDQATRDAYLCLLEDFRQHTPASLTGTRYADPASRPTQQLERRLEARVQYWRDQAVRRAAEQVALVTPEQRLARLRNAKYQKYGPLAGMVRLCDGVALLTADLTTGSNSQPTEPPPATESTTKNRKRGPKPDYVTAAAVAEIVTRVAPSGEWRHKLDEICKAFDQAQIPYPSKWSTRYRTTCWSDYPEKSFAVKAIDGRLKLAKRKPEPIPETRS
ncbi:MAG: hypothetical protein ABSH47_20790 [Bryobacteraceae bacterium]